LILVLSLISLNHGPVRVSTLLPPFQNVGRFDIFRFIYFVMDLDICYI